MNALTKFILITGFIFYYLPHSTFAQIPNAGFEIWPTCLCDPVDWTTNNIYPPPLDCRQVFADFLPYAGDICVLGIVDSCEELEFTYPPRLTSIIFPIAEKPEALHGFYKYLPVGGDKFVVEIGVLQDSVIVGSGELESTVNVPFFTEFVVNIEYTVSDTPNVAVISFTIDSSEVSNYLHIGSQWFIDQLFFGPISAVQDDIHTHPNFFKLEQNHPNPFNPTTTIKYEIKELTDVELKVVDILGREIATLVNEQKPAGSYEIEFNASSLPSGIYFYGLQAVPTGRQAGSFVETKKMVLMK